MISEIDMGGQNLVQSKYRMFRWLTTVLDTPKKNLHEDRVRQHANRRDLTFRVFVSSTFSDLIGERNALQERTFPSISRYCQERGARFQAIDLRWGVSEEAALDQQTMNLCVEELRRCQELSPRPNFIVLLGERYGWRPLPPQIEATELETITGNLDQVKAERLLWREEQPLHAKGWYRLDKNAVPPEYCLQARSGEFVDPERWAEKESELRSLLLEGLNRLPVGTIHNGWKYHDSATHQEIRHGVLESSDPQNHVFCYFRKVDGLPEDGRAKDHRDIRQGVVDTEARERLDSLKAVLKDLLPPDHIHGYVTTWSDNGPHWDEKELNRFCKDVETDLKKAIDIEIEAFQQRPELNREIEAHKQFAEQVSRHFVGRSDLLDRIRNYLADPDDRRPLVIFGASGSGKTALMAQAWLTLTDTSESIARFVGATPGSADLRPLLTGLCHQLGVDSSPSDAYEAAMVFRESLSGLRSGTDKTTPD